MVSISGSAHLQGRQWVDMSGWSEGSEDKGEVCVRCEGVGGVGGSQESSNSVLHAATHNTCSVQMPHLHTHTHTHTHIYPPHMHACTHTPTNLLVPAPPSSSSQVTASLGSPLRQWPPHNTPSDCPYWHDVPSDGTRPHVHPWCWRC